MKKARIIIHTYILNIYIYLFIVYSRARAEKHIFCSYINSTHTHTYIVSAFVDAISYFFSLSLSLGEEFMRTTQLFKLLKQERNYNIHFSFTSRTYLIRIFA